MESERMAGLLQKIPFFPLLFLYLGYLGWDLYSFQFGPDSPIRSKQEQVESLQAGNHALQVRIQQASDFYRNLDQKRAELRLLAQQLDEMKLTLSDQLDVPSLIKLIVNEAAKTGLSVLGIRPTESKSNEYYVEQIFELKFRSVYVQLLLFMERISNSERVIRVDDFDFRRTGSSIAPYVELNGTLQVKAYRYLGSKADDIVQTGMKTLQEAAPEPKGGN